MPYRNFNKFRHRRFLNVEKPKVTGLPIPTDSLAFWWDAGFNVYQDGSQTPSEDTDPVQEWHDRISGYVVRQTTAAAQPTMLKNVAGLNGANAVSFDGTDDTIIHNDSFVWSGEDQPFSLFVAYQIQTVTSETLFIGIDTTGGLDLLSISTIINSRTRCNIRDDPGTGSKEIADAASPDPDTNPTVAMVVSTGTIGQIVINDVIHATDDADVGTVRIDEWRIGNAVEIYITDVIFYERLLSFSERDIVNDYLMNKIGAT